MTFVWSFVLVSLLNYVVGSIANTDFNFQAGAIISVGLAVLIILLGEALPTKPVSDH